MAYPSATADHLPIYREHGYLVVRNAIPQNELDEIEAHGALLIEQQERLGIHMQDVDPINDCMHFVDAVHALGVLPHHGVEGVQSDLPTCEADQGNAVVCPIKRGDVTFHHFKTQHMANANPGALGAVAHRPDLAARSAACAEVIWVSVPA